MAETRTKRKAEEKDLVARLADAGEEALQRLSELPGGQRAAHVLHDLRARVDELAKKARGVDALEARVSKLEKEVAALKRKTSPRARGGTPD
jgi:ubiquinone biosynthesis protein UbiJ